MIDEKRLIEFLENKLGKKTDYICNYVEEESDIIEYFQGEINNLLWVLNVIKAQPKVGEWIPCSERLPVQEKLLQTYLITFEYYRYGEYNCMYKTVGTGTFDKNIQEFIFVNQQTGWKDLNVLAWQPLPKPYEEKENA